jgi:hypothetical protein
MSADNTIVIIRDDEAFYVCHLMGADEFLVGFGEEIMLDQDSFKDYFDDYPEDFEEYPDEDSAWLAAERLEDYYGYVEYGIERFPDYEGVLNG